MKQRKQNRRGYGSFWSLFFLLAISAAISVRASAPSVQMEVLPNDTVPVVVPEPLYIVNGIKLPNEIVTALNPDCIKELEVLRGDSAIARYGERGAYGVLIFTLKSPEEIRAERSGKRIEAFLKSNGAVGSRGVRYYIDGKEVSAAAAYEVNIDQMEMKTGADGKLEIYIKPMLMIRGDN